MKTFNTISLGLISLLLSVTSIRAADPTVTPETRKTLDFQPVRPRFVRLEFGKFGSYPLDLSELRLFPPLEESSKR